MLELVSRADRPFDRDCYAPGHFTASGFVLAPDGGRVLLVLHSTLCRWLQPGGHVEPVDAGLAAAARREVLEETGIAELDEAGPGAFDLDVHPIPKRGATPGHLHFDVRFLFRSRSERIAPSAEVGGARWIGLAEAAALARDASIARALGKLPGDR
jgi:8-oxo-dGTP pyrophosphatase MutT (NUDIX family)